MARVGADYVDDASTADDLAVLTNSLDAGTDFHDYLYKASLQSPKRFSISFNGLSLQGPPKKIFSDLPWLGIDFASFGPFFLPECAPLVA